MHFGGGVEGEQELIFMHVSAMPDTGLGAQGNDWTCSVPGGLSMVLASLMRDPRFA